MRSTRRGSVAWVALGIVAVASTVPAVAEPSATTAVSHTFRPFAADDPFNSVISASAAIDPNSRAMMDAIASDGAHAGLVDFGIPISTATASTPRYLISCTGSASWGPCPLAGASVPIPDDARVQPGSDAAMVVIDPAGDKVYEFWRAHKNANSWATVWGSVSTLSGSAWMSSATAAGASRLAGVIRLSEVQAGVIPHALAIQSSNTCARVWREPATKTDGASERPDCIPEGTRLQLDPTLDIPAMKTPSPAERAVAVALQTYGAYVIDTGGAKLSVSFELAPDATEGSPGSLYTSMGMNWDYTLLDKIPWDHLRALTTWNGTA